MMIFSQHRLYVHNEYDIPPTLNIIMWWFVQYSYCAHYYSPVLKELANKPLQSGKIDQTQIRVDWWLARFMHFSGNNKADVISSTEMILSKMNNFISKGMTYKDWIFEDGFIYIRNEILTKSLDLDLYSLFW